MNGSAMDKAMVGSSDAHFYKMIGNGYTMFEGETAEELRKSIENRSTSFGGINTPLKMGVEWAMEVASKSGVMILKSLVGIPIKSDDPVTAKIRSLPIQKKILSLLAIIAVITPPLPLIYAIVGDKIMKRKSRKKLGKFLN
jgi:hypothetical protein